MKELDDEEIKFWNNLLSDYLKPLDEDKEKQKKDSEGLKVIFFIVIWQLAEVYIYVSLFFFRN